MRSRRLAVAGALALLVVLGFAGSAHACSCALMRPGELLREADAAIVGRLVAVVPHGRFQADYRYEVQRVYRGAKAIEAGETISVRSARRAAACALPRRMDRRYGLFLTRDSGRWRSGICAVISPRRLWAAAQQQRRAGRTGSAPAGPDCPS